jgi:RNA recognition motif-containing protein
VNRRLHIGNLAYSVTNEELEKLFSSEGSVTSAKVIRSLDGRSKGFGFVEMETEEEASKAMEKYDQSSFKDRTIWVNEAKPPKNRGFSENKGGYRGYNRKHQDDLNSRLRRLRKRY